MRTLAHLWGWDILRIHLQHKSRVGYLKDGLAVTTHAGRLERKTYLTGLPDSIRRVPAGSHVWA